MNVKYLWAMLQGIGSGITLGAGVTSIAFSIIAAFIVVPPVVSFPLIAIIGVAIGVIGAVYSHREYLKAKLKEQAEQRREEAEKLKEEAEKLKEDAEKFKEETEKLKEEDVTQVEKNIVSSVQNLEKEMVGMQQDFNRRLHSVPDLKIVRAEPDASSYKLSKRDDDSVEMDSGIKLKKSRKHKRKKVHKNEKKMQSEHDLKLTINKNKSMFFTQPVNDKDYEQSSANRNRPRMI